MSEKPQPRIHSIIVGDETREEAPRLVFLHGLFGRGKNFTRIARELSDEYTSLLVDLPNHGESGWTEDFRYEQMADLVAEHVRSNFAKHDPVHVIGHSMGGKVAMVLALRHPELVDRLIVVDIAPVGSGGNPGEFPHLLGALRGLNLANISSRTEAHEALKEQIPQDTVRGFLLQNLSRTNSGFAWEPNLELLYQQLDAIMGFPDVGGATFTHRVLWIGGERSNYISDADEPAMRALFPSTVRVTIRGAGHWVHSEQPDDFVATVRAFLQA